MDTPPETLPAELWVVRLIQKLLAQGWSLRAIAQELNQMRVRTNRGSQRWYTSKVHAVRKNSLHAEAT